jgi:hypothetical protein
MTGQQTPPYVKSRSFSCVPPSLPIPLPSQRARQLSLGLAAARPLQPPPPPPPPVPSSSPSPPPLRTAPGPIAPPASRSAAARAAPRALAGLRPPQGDTALQRSSSSSSSALLSHGRGQPRPPPRRPVELLLETEGAGAVTVPRWILDRMAEMEASGRGGSRQQRPVSGVATSALRPLAIDPAFSGVSFSASYAAAASGGARRSGRAQAVAPYPQTSMDEDAHLSALSSSAGSMTDGGGGGGGGGKAARQHRQHALAPEDGDEDEDEDEVAGVEVLEARLRGWLAERERFAAAREEVQLLQQQLLLQAHEQQHQGQQARLEQLRGVLQQAYPTWRAQTLPRIRRVHERIRRWKELEASGASSVAAAETDRQG